MKPVRLRHRARRELREATAWYRERSSEVAERFSAEVRKTLRHLEQFPDTGSYVPGATDPGVRRLPVRNFPYHVVFIRQPHLIDVIAIAHARRRPGYWNE